MRHNREEDKDATTTTVQGITQDSREGVFPVLLGCEVSLELRRKEVAPNMKELPSFEDMVKMAQDDPEALEALRQEVCEAVIESAPEDSHRRLRGLQFKIDMERRRAKTPMASCIRISQMMHESFGDLRNALNDMQGTPTQTLRSLVKDPLLTSEQPSEKENAAEVIDFPVN